MRLLQLGFQLGLHSKPAIARAQLNGLHRVALLPALAALSAKGKAAPWQWNYKWLSKFGTLQ